MSDRRTFIKTAGAAAVMGLAGTVMAQNNTKKLLLGISCSPRSGKTTAASVQVALDAAGSSNPRIETKLIDLGGKTIAGWTPPATTPRKEDDFDALLPILKSPNLGGLIIGTPVYFRNMSSLCAAFLERLGELRTPSLLLANKIVGALAVGAYRNGGQELAIQQILTAMLCHEALVVGGKPGAHQGATLWNAFQDDISKDEFGITSAKNLGIRVAEAMTR